MIVSHKHKFIFIKTMKTAGTSVEILLSKYCGERDIITPISGEDESLRREFGGRGPQNHRYPIWWHIPWWCLRRVGLLKSKPRFYNHMSAAMVRREVGEDVWNSYFKFCFERNPWDRVISLYYWLYPTDPRPSLTEFLNSKKPLNLRRLGYRLYTVDGQVVVDRVCCYENLSGELTRIGKELGLPEDMELPHAKASTRKDRRSYREVLDPAQQNKVAELFREETELLGYRF